MAVQRLSFLFTQCRHLANSIHASTSYLKPCNHIASISTAAKRSAAFTVDLRSVRSHHGYPHARVDTAYNLQESASEILENLSPEEALILRCLKVEHEVWLTLDYDVPAFISDTRWLELLKDHRTEQSRSAVYAYWVHRDQAEQKKRIGSGRKGWFQDETNHSEETSFLLYPSQETIEKHYTNNLAQAMSFGVPLIFDFGFEGEMLDSDLSRLMSEFQSCYKLNKHAKDPFHFHLSGVVPGSKTHQTLQEEIPDCGSIPFTVTEESFLECYPQKKIVYLTADSPRVLKKYSRNYIYVIGSLSKITEQTPLTYVKAKREKIGHARLPLNKYLWWKDDYKALTIHQVLRIMLELKASNNWHRALQYIHPKLHRDSFKDN